MEHRNDSQETFRNYLLGRLRGEDLEAFEKRLLTEDEDFEELLASTEDDLVDQYTGGDLSREDREAFEKHYLITDERQEEIDFARTLNRYFKKQRTLTPVPVERFNWASILRVAVVAVVFAILAVPVYRLIRPTPNITTITLNPSIVTRSEESQAPKVNLGEADILRLSLNLPAQFPTGTQYRAELEGSPQPVNVTNQDSRTVTVEIPTDALRKGQNALKLFAVPTGQAEQPIQINYSFTVE